MDIKVIYDDEKKSSITHRDVIQYTPNTGNGAESLDVTIRGGEEKSIPLQDVHKLLIIKPYCLYEKGVGFIQKK